MKKILLFIFLLASLVTAQTESTKTIYELKINAAQIQTLDESRLFPSDQVNEKKSGFLAIVYSLLLPGMGELYAGNYEKGKYFTVAEGISWSVFAGFNIYGNWQRNNYKSFASTNGSVNLDGKDADFFANISEFTNIDDYNRRKSLDREFGEIYEKEKYYWKWADVAQRTEYRTMWESSEHAFNNVRFAVGALIINRIISAIDAALMVRSYNKNLPTQTSWNLSVGTNRLYPSGMEINFLKSF